MQPFRRDVCGSLTLVGLALVAAVIEAPLSQAQTETVLNTFTGGADGGNPAAGVIRDTAGNLYGTTYSGGASGVGVVFKLDTSSKETVLYTFTGGADGANPGAGVIRDSAGNLYGTTQFGGVPGGTGACGFPGCGVVFKVASAGKETALYSFTGGADGSLPYSGLLRDKAGNLYGTTYAGGLASSACEYGTCGVVFKLTPPSVAGGAWTETVLYSFTGGADGGDPMAGLISDSVGNLYGTTQFGGVGYPGFGVVFKLTPPAVAGGSWTETAIYSFKGAPDGANPVAGVLRDKAGSLFGTTLHGGLGWGVVFKVDARGNEAVLYSFTGGIDGSLPGAALLRGKAGNFYGTTYGGGNGPCGRYPGGCGVVFKVTPPAVAGGSWTEMVLYSFKGYPTDGEYPSARMIRDNAGNLYSTTYYGGSSCPPVGGCGTVFMLKP
jgi:uncharacterized repeat protein (TIGR03803 family)